MANSPDTPSAQTRDERICRARYFDKIAELTAVQKRLSRANLRDEEREEIEQELEVLSIESIRVLKITLSWGGPSDGFKLTFSSDGELLSGCYWYADWFTYAEESLSKGEVELICDLYLGGDASAFFGRV